MLFFTALFVSGPANAKRKSAKTEQPAAAANDSAPTAEQVQRLMVLTGAADMAGQAMDQMLAPLMSHPGIPKEFWEGFKAKVNPNELVEMIVPIYQEHLTAADVEGLITFWQSPVGQKFLSKQGVIMQQSMQAGQAWGEKMGAEVQKELQNQGM